MPLVFYYQLKDLTNLWGGGGKGWWPDWAAFPIYVWFILGLLYILTPLTSFFNIYIINSDKYKKFKYLGKTQIGNVKEGRVLNQVMVNRDA